MKNKSFKIFYLSIFLPHVIIFTSRKVCICNINKFMKDIYMYNIRQVNFYKFKKYINFWHLLCKLGDTLDIEKGKVSHYIYNS